MFKLLAIENEDNVLICLRTIIELHKAFRPEHRTDITAFLSFVKSIYRYVISHVELEVKKNRIWRKRNLDFWADIYNLSTKN